MVQIEENREYNLPEIERFINGINATKEEDMFLLFGMINPEDQSLFVQVQDSLERDFKIPKKRSRKLWNKYQEKFQWETIIQEKETKTYHTLNKMTPKGIFEVKIYMANDKPTEEIFYTNLWLWDSFKVDCCLVDESLNVEKYDFTHNGKSYKNQEFEQIRDKVAQQSLLKSRNKQILGPLFHKHIKEQKIPFQFYSKICGFTNEGWRLLDKYRTNFNIGIQEDMGNLIEEMSSMEINNDKAKKYMKNLYDCIHIEEKDLWFAIAMILPFQYSLRPETDLIPYYCSYSPLYTTGKTAIAITITQKIWNNFKTVINKDNFGSASRVGDYLSCSPFGIVIDDCGDLDDKSKENIKSYLTEESSFTRKNKDQSKKTDRPYCASIIFTFNNIPIMFDDTALLSRGCIIPQDKKLTNKDKQIFKKTMKEIPNGYIGKYIYENTQNWTINDLINIYNDQEDFSSEIRQNTIYKLVKTGSILFERLFGFSINIERIKKFIEETTTLGSDEVFTVFREIIKDGIKKRVKFYNKAIEDYDYDWKFIPDNKWIKSPVIKIIHNKNNGCVFTNNNLKDLKDRTNRKDINLIKLRLILSKKLPNIPKKMNFTSQSNSYYGIFIEDGSFIVKDDLNDTPP